MVPQRRPQRVAIRFSFWDVYRLRSKGVLSSHTPSLGQYTPIFWILMRLFPLFRFCSQVSLQNIDSLQSLFIDFHKKVSWIIFFLVPWIRYQHTGNFFECFSFVAGKSALTAEIIVLKRCKRFKLLLLHSLWPKASLIFSVLYHPHIRHGASLAWIRFQQKHSAQRHGPAC